MTPQGTETLSKKCPHCGLVNPDTTGHCDCGYNFATGEVDPALIAAEKAKSKKPLLITPLVVVYILGGILASVFVRWGIFLGVAQFVIAWGTAKMRRWAWYANLGWCALAIFGWFMGSSPIPVLLLFMLVAAYMFLPDTRRAFGIGKSHPKTQTS